MNTFKGEVEVNSFTYEISEEGIAILGACTIDDNGKKHPILITMPGHKWKEFREKNKSLKIPFKVNINNDEIRPIILH